MVIFLLRWDIRANNPAVISIGKAVARWHVSLPHGERPRLDVHELPMNGLLQDYLTNNPAQMALSLLTKF